MRMLIGIVLSMLSQVCHIKELPHRVWLYFKAHLAYIMAAFNILALWNGLEADENGFVHLSIARSCL